MTDPVVAVIYLVGNERSFGRDGLSDIGTFLAEEIAEALQGPHAAAAATAGESIQRRPLVWRRQTESEAFPRSFRVALVVVTQDSLDVAAGNAMTVYSRDVEEVCRRSTLNDQPEEGVPYHQSATAVVVAFLGVSRQSIGSTRNDFMEYRNDDWAIVELEYLRFAEADMHSRLHQHVVNRVVQLTVARFRNDLQHDAAEEEEDEIARLAINLRNGWCSALQWSHFPQLLGSTQQAPLSLSEASRLLINMALNRDSHVLTTIQLRGNDLGNDFFRYQFSDALVACPSITKLILGLNGIQSSGAEALAKSIKRHTPHLRLLFLNDNEIGNDGFEKVIRHLNGMRHMGTLNLDANSISFVPSTIELLRHTTWLKLCRNEIETFPEEIASLLPENGGKLQHLQIKGNPLKNPPLAVVEEWYGAESSGRHTLEYLSAYLKDSRRRDLITIRVLGHGGVGKTTFIAAMKKYWQDRTVLQPSGPHIVTEGITVEEVRAENVTLRFVEFGGQPQYLPIHRAFLDSLNAVFVVLYRADSGGDDGYKSALFWMSYVASISRLEQRDPVFLCSTHNARESTAVFPVLDLVTHITSSDEPIMERIVGRFRVDQANAVDLHYDMNVPDVAWTLQSLAIIQRDESPPMPASYLDLLQHCRFMAEREQTQVLSVQSLKTTFVNATDHRPEILRGALKVLTQFGDIVALEEMTHVYTNPHIVFLCAARVMDSLQEGDSELDGTCSVEDIRHTVSEVTQSSDDAEEQAKNMLLAMCVLNLCYPISEVDRSYLRNVRSANPAFSQLWMFPSGRSSAGSRSDVVRTLTEQGHLQGFECTYGLQFTSLSGFLPPGALALVEMKLKPLASILRCTRNTVVVALGSLNRVVLSYRNTERTPALEAVAFGSVEECRRALDIVFVLVVRVIDSFFSSLKLSVRALCPLCCSEETCCSFPYPDGLRFLTERQAFERRLADSHFVCLRTREELNWDKIFPVPEATSTWTRHWAYDVFISHAGEDTHLAREIFKNLCALNVRCFLDQASVGRTSDVGGTMDVIMTRCRFCLCLVTEKYCENNWTLIEYDHFLEREPLEGPCLLPVLLDIDDASFTSKTRRRWAQSNPILEISDTTRELTSEVFDDFGRSRVSFSAVQLHNLCRVVNEKVNSAAAQMEREDQTTRAVPGPRMPPGQAIAPQTGSIFISHAGTEKETLARPLSNLLREMGQHSVFLDDESIHPFENVRDAIYRGIREAKAVVFFFTENFFNRDWPLRELDIFLFMENYVRENFGLTLKIYGFAPYKGMPDFLRDHSEIASRRIFTGRDLLRRQTGHASDPRATRDENYSERLETHQLEAFVTEAARWVMEDLGRLS